MLFHASYVVICHASKDCDILTINENELVAKSRLGTAVKKTILLSYFNKEGGDKCNKSEKNVKFKVLKWTASNSSTESIAPENNYNPAGSIEKKDRLLATDNRDT